MPVLPHIDQLGLALAGFLLQHLADAHLAVAALAAPHHGPRAVLDGGHRRAAERIVDRLQDLRAGDLFAAAHDLAVIRVLCDQSGLVRRTELLESRDRLPDRVKREIFLKFLPLQHHGDRVARDRYRGCQTGRLDADEIDRVRGDVVDDLYFEILDPSVFVDQLGQNAAVGADVVAALDVGPYFDRFFVEIVEVFLFYAVVGEVVRLLGGRAQQHVAVRGDGDVDAHVGVGGDRVDRHGDQAAQTAVQDDIVVLGADDAVAGEPEHVGDLPAAEAGRVDDPAGVEQAVNGHDGPGAVLFAADVRHFAVKKVLGPIVRRILRKRDGEHEGIKDPAVLGQESEPAFDGGHEPVQLFLADHSKAGRTVDFALRHDAQQLFVFLVGIADQDLAAALEAESELLGQLSHHLVALDAEARFQRARVVGKAAVADACVAGAGLKAHIQVLLQDRDVQLVAGQLPRHGASDDAGADNDHVICLFHGVSFLLIF